jgi:hypothetical protein
MTTPLTEQPLACTHLLAQAFQDRGGAQVNSLASSFYTGEVLAPTPGEILRG